NLWVIVGGHRPDVRFDVGIPVRSVNSADYRLGPSAAHNHADNFAGLRTEAALSKGSESCGAAEVSSETHLKPDPSGCRQHLVVAHEYNLVDPITDRLENALVRL